MERCARFTRCLSGARVLTRRVHQMICLCLFCGGLCASIAEAEPPDADAVRSLVARLHAADQAEPAFVAEWDAPRGLDVIVVAYSPRTGAYMKATGKRSLAVRTPDGREFGRIGDEKQLEPRAHPERTEPNALAIVDFVPQSLRRVLSRAPEAVESIEGLEDGGIRVEAALLGEVLGTPPPGEHLSLIVWFDRDARVVRWSVTGYDQPVEPTFTELNGVRLPTNMERWGGWRLRNARIVTEPDAQFFDPAAVTKLVESVGPPRADREPDGRTLAEVAGIGQPVSTRTTRSWALIVVGALAVVVGVVAWIRRRA